MPHFLYIIHSESTSRYYVGETHDPEQRLFQHNEHHFPNSFTNIAKDWRFVLLWECEQRKDALRLEGFIKRMKSRAFIEKIIATPNLLNDIANRK